jgi:L-malate glycosyltransferase
MQKLREPAPKVMHVILSLSMGGAEKLVYDMMHHSLFEKVQPIVCCLQSVGILGEKLIEEGYKVYFRQREEGVDFGIITWLRDIIRQEKIDIVHAHQYTPLFYSVPAAKLAGRIKVVYTEHGRLFPDSRRWKRYIFNPLLALGVDHLVSISESTRQAMAHFDNFPLRRIQVIHNGVVFNGRPQIDLQAKRRSLGIDDHARIVGTAARLDRIKNFPMMFRAFRQVLVELPEACLLIAGEGPMERDLKQYALDLGIAEKVYFLGMRRDLHEIYELYEVFLLSSWTEGISVTLLEAMSHRLPTVATKVGGNTEVVVDGVTGSLIELDDDLTMAEKVIYLLKNSDLRTVYGRNGFERVKRHFTFDGMINAYSRNYQS